MVKDEYLAKMKMLDDMVSTVAIKRKKPPSDHVYVPEVNRKLKAGKSSQNELYSSVEKIFPEVNSDEISVVCFVGFKEVNKSLTEAKYFVIPIDGYNITSDGIKFETGTVFLNNRSVNCVKETKIGFKKKDIIYPLLKSALPSLGQYMNAVSAYQEMTEIPLGSAMNLSEKMADDLDVKLCCVKDKGLDVCPVIAIGSKKSICGQFYEMFNSFFNAMSERGLYQLKCWTISYDTSSVTVILRNENGENLDVSFETSNLAGHGNKVTISAYSGTYSVILSQNTGYKTAKYSVEEALSKAFDEIVHIPDDVTLISYAPSDAFRGALEKAYGKKRMAKLKTSYVGIKKEVSRNIIEDTYCFRYEIGDKRFEALCSAYRIMFTEIENLV